MRTNDEEVWMGLWIKGHVRIVTVIACAVLALEDAQGCAARTGEHLNEALSAVAHLHA